MVQVTTRKKRKRYTPFWKKALKDFFQPLTSFARKLASNKIYDPEDLLHETALRALNCSTNPRKILNPLSYLFRIMQNISRDWDKKINAANMISLDDESAAPALQPQLPAIDPRFSKTEEYLEELSIVTSHLIKLGKLTRLERRMLKLYLEDHTWEESAAILQMSVGSLKTDWHRLLAKLRYYIRKGRAKTARQGKP